MKRYRMFSATLETGMEFIMKIDGRDYDEFNAWIASVPSITKCEQIRAAAPIRGHSSKNTAIARARMAAGFTQQEVADQLGVKIQQYQTYEYNQHHPKTQDLMRLGEILGVDFTTLMEYED